MKKTLVLCSKYWIEIMKYQICMLKLPLENETLKEVFLSSGQSCKAISFIMENFAVEQ